MVKGLAWHRGLSFGFYGSEVFNLSAEFRGEGLGFRAMVGGHMCQRTSAYN